MTGRVTGKKALVTGAAQGLGAAIARTLAIEGAQVTLTDKNAALVSAVAAQINAHCGKEVATAFEHDVTDETAWQHAIQHARQFMGGLSVLVNNAGVVKVGSVEQLDFEAWRQGMAVNVDSVFLAVRTALPCMKENQPGSIINISSISGLIAAHNFANYNASKAAVWMLSKSIALHCAHQGWKIRCNSVHPAFIKTPILQSLMPGRDDDTIDARLKKQVPLGRLGEPEDVANAVLYLASDESAFVTGAELKLDGGISAM